MMAFRWSRYTRIVEAELLGFLGENPHPSVRKLLSTCNVTKTVVRGILQEQLLYCYHVQIVYAMPVGE